MQRLAWGSDLPTFRWPGAPDCGAAAADGAQLLTLERSDLAPGYERLFPPESMREYGTQFLRDERMEAFIRNEFTLRGGLFWDKEHAHLAEASIGFVWSSAPHVQRGKEKAGMMELLPDPDSRPRTWAEGRKRDYLSELYDGEWPRFQMTLSGVWAWRMDDRSFFALADHECCHAGVRRDDGGAPKVSERTGEPEWMIRPHDYEGFAGTVERFGAAADGAEAIVTAAQRSRPVFAWVPGRADVRFLCASCRN